jgi:hypothetical protein
VIVNISLCAAYDLADGQVLQINFQHSADYYLGIDDIICRLFLGIHDIIQISKTNLHTTTVK